MNFVGKVVSTVADFYGGINPATLSGAIDIVVVERKDGELCCSPFHVRFGKLKLLRPIEKKVAIFINGEITGLEMKVGEAGEAFFVVEADNPVPSEYATSPIPQPTLPSDDLNGDVLDLGDSIAIDVVQLPKTGGKPSPRSRPRSSSDRPLPEHYDDTFKVEEAEDDYPMSDSDVDLENLREGRPKEPSSLGQVVGSPSNGWSWTWGGLPVKDDEVVSGSPEQTEFLHSGDNQADNPVAENCAPWSSESVIDQRPISSLSSALKANPLVPEEPLSVKEKIGSFLASLPDEHKSSPLDTDDAQSLAPKPEYTGAKAETAQNSGLQVVEMSLCGKKHLQSVLNQANQVFKERELLFEAEAHFDAFKLSYETFCEDPSILSNPDLVVRLNRTSYFDGPTASVILLSFTAYQKFPPVSFLSRLWERPISGTGASNESKRVSSFGQGLRQWWSRGASSESQDSGLLSISPPKSPSVPSAYQASETAEKEKDRVKETENKEKDPGNERNKEKEKEKEMEKPKRSRPLGFKKTLRLTSEQLKTLNLKKGVNTITFSVTSRLQGTASCTSKIFFWDHDVNVVISDVDGTITKSDVFGHILTMVGRDWTHSGVASLYTNIRKNGYQILYLTSRAIGQYAYTRDYLMKIEQGSYQLPDGPVIMSPDRLFTALHREVIQRKPEIFKIAALRDIKSLFGDKTPFYAGFGNRITDALAYRAVHVPPSRIFTIDPSGEVKLELLSSYKSSYIKLNDIVDQIFPAVGKGLAEGFGDFEFWRQPLVDIELETKDAENSAAAEISAPKTEMGSGDDRPSNSAEDETDALDGDADSLHAHDEAEDSEADVVEEVEETDEESLANLAEKVRTLSSIPFYD
ncbi:hypothetical protein HDU97_005343 [Phlyctochytrium planicorne]|nr:hypothetical protein HDU97_005343 [Phlyctochytrium planicorne]